jgi:hypothetical protein
MRGRIVQSGTEKNRGHRELGAPYKVLLDDGRNIFAPGDLPQIIKERPVEENAAE